MKKKEKKNKRPKIPSKKKCFVEHRSAKPFPSVDYLAEERESGVFMLRQKGELGDGLLFRVFRMTGYGDVP